MSFLSQRNLLHDVPIINCSGMLFKFKWVVSIITNSVCWSILVDDQVLLTTSTDQHLTIWQTAVAASSALNCLQTILFIYSISSQYDESWAINFSKSLCLNMDSTTSVNLCSIALQVVCWSEILHYSTHVLCICHRQRLRDNQSHKLLQCNVFSKKHVCKSCYISVPIYIMFSPHDMTDPHEL